MKQLRLRAIEIYRINPINGWIISIFTGLFLLAVTGVNFLINGLGLICIPLLALPALFAAYVTFVSFRYQSTLTFSNYIRSFGAFFKRENRSCFRFLLSFLSALIISLITSLICSLIVYLILNPMYPGVINELINKIYALLYGGEADVEQLKTLFEQYSHITVPYFVGVSVPSFVLAAIFFIYQISNYSLSIYLRLANVALPGQFCTLLVGRTIKKNRWKFLKEQIFLNWPLYLLLAIGFTGGVLFDLYVVGDYYGVISYGIMFAMVAIIFFLPFYFPNMNAIYEHHVKDFQTEYEVLNAEMLQSLQSNITLNEEEIERLQKMFKPNNEDKKEDENKDKEE